MKYPGTKAYNMHCWRNKSLLCPVFIHWFQVFKKFILWIQNLFMQTFLTLLPFANCCRTERKVFEVLNQASLRIAQDLDAFWSTFMHLDVEGNGHIDVTMTARFFKNLFYVSTRRVLSMLRCTRREVFRPRTRRLLRISFRAFEILMSFILLTEIRPIPLWIVWTDGAVKAFFPFRIFKFWIQT
jgi:hypothetical protein